MDIHGNFKIYIYSGGQKELLRLHFLGNEGLQQCFLLTPMAKQSISKLILTTSFDRAPVILRNFFMGKSRCIPGSPGDYL